MNNKLYFYIYNKSKNAYEKFTQEQWDLRFKKWDIKNVNFGLYPYKDGKIKDVKQIKKLLPPKNITLKSTDIWSMLKSKIKKSSMFIVWSPIFVSDNKYIHYDLGNASSIFVVGSDLTLDEINNKLNALPKVGKKTKGLDIANELLKEQKEKANAIKGNDAEKLKLMIDKVIPKANREITKGEVEFDYGELSKSLGFWIVRHLCSKFDYKKESYEDWFPKLHIFSCLSSGEGGVSPELCDDLCRLEEEYPGEYEYIIVRMIDDSELTFLIHNDFIEQYGINYRLDISDLIKEDVDIEDEDENENSNLKEGFQTFKKLERILSGNLTEEEAEDEDLRNAVRAFNGLGQETNEYEEEFNELIGEGVLQKDYFEKMDNGEKKGKVCSIRGKTS